MNDGHLFIFININIEYNQNNMSGTEPETPPTTPPQTTTIPTSAEEANEQNASVPFDLD